MALPAWRSSVAVTGNVAAQTPAAPSGLAVNDVELLLVESANEQVQLSTANGFAALPSPNPVSVPNADILLATRLTIFWRRWDGVAGDPTIQDAGNHTAASRSAFSGCITTGNPWDIIVGSSEATEDTSGSADGGTTTVDECLIAICVATAKPDAASTVQLSAWANADLANLTERVEGAIAAGNGGLVGLATGEKATAGAFGATTYTHATATYKAHLVVALKPPPPLISLRSQHLDYDYSR